LNPGAASGNIFLVWHYYLTIFHFQNSETLTHFLLTVSTVWAYSWWKCLISNLFYSWLPWHYHKQDAHTAKNTRCVGDKWLYATYCKTRESGRCNVKM